MKIQTDHGPLDLVKAREWLKHSPLLIMDQRDILTALEAALNANLLQSCYCSARARQAARVIEEDETEPPAQ